MDEEPPAEERLTPAPSPAPRKTAGKRLRKTTAAASSKTPKAAPAAAPASKTAPASPAAKPAGKAAPAAPAAKPAPPGGSKPATTPAKE